MEDALKQTRKIIELRMEYMLLDGDPIPEPKNIAFHQNNPEYAGGQWESVAVILPTDVSKIQVDQPGPIQRLFRWFNQATHVVR